MTGCPLQPRGSQLITPVSPVELPVLPPPPSLSSPQMLDLFSVRPCSSFNGFVSLSLQPFSPPHLPNPPTCVPSPGAKLSSQAPLSLSRNAAGDAAHAGRVTGTCACGAGSDALSLSHLWFSHRDLSLCFSSWLVHSLSFLSSKLFFLFVFLVMMMMMMMVIMVLHYELSPVSLFLSLVNFQTLLRC